MGVSYDKKSKTWKVTYEKDDNPVSNTFTLPVEVTKFSTGYGGKAGAVSTPYQETVNISFNINDTEKEIIKKLEEAGANVNPRWYRKAESVENALAEQERVQGENRRNIDRNETAKKNNAIYKNVYDTGIGLQKSKTPGNYLVYKKVLDSLPEGTPGVRGLAKADFDDFYTAEIVSLWDQKNAAKVPFEGFENTIRFDPNYYGSETKYGKPSKELWDKAVQDGDLDVLGRYGNYEAYALWHYSTIGKNEAQKNKDRDPGFKPTSPLDGYKYLGVEESVPGKTDLDRQFERDKFITDTLGLKEGEKGYELRDTKSEYEALFGQDKELAEKWDKIKFEVEYANRFPSEPKSEWVNLYETIKDEAEYAPDLSTPSGFVSFLNIASQLDASKYPELSTLINDIQKDPKTKDLTSKLSAYDVQLTKIFTEAEKQKTIKAGQLQTEFLKLAQAELVKAKKKEQAFDMIANTSIGKEILSMRGNVIGSALEDSGIGGILSLTGRNIDDFTKEKDISIDTGSILGSRNGILYNWERWFRNEIEKKYSKDLNVPDDYVSEYMRTEENGFIPASKLAEWKEYDEAFERLKKYPNSFSARKKTDPKNLPKGYIPVEKRKTVKQEWLNYEAERRKRGWVDNKTLAEWAKYDEAYAKLNKNLDDKNAKEVLKSLPADYIPKNKRVDSDEQFQQDFFNEYLTPRFDRSKSMSEFLDYIDVEKKNQNIFQTEDRLVTLKNAAEAASAQWLKAVESLSPTKFNTKYYFDPADYYIKNGVKSGEKDVLLGEAFSEQWGNQLPKQYVEQRDDVNSAWEAAKAGKTTKDQNGQEINWQAKAYMYGLDVTNQDEFAQLHYQLVGQFKNYDGAPDVFNPKLAEIYLEQTLMPTLSERYASIGTVFGQFADPEAFADKFVENLNVAGNKEERDKIFKLYGLDPEDEDLTTLKKYISEALTGSNAVEIRERIKELNEAGEIPTQEALGVEYIQRASDKREEAAKSDDELYNRFKSAGYKGTEDEFYAEFMPDATEEDREMYKLTSPAKLKETYSFKPTGNVFADLGKLESLSQSFEDKPDQLLGAKKTGSPTSKYFSFFPDEAEEAVEEDEFSSPVKIKRGSDILAEFKSRLNLSPTAGKSTKSDLSDPFSSSFFGSF